MTAREESDQRFLVQDGLEPLQHEPFRDAGAQIRLLSFDDDDDDDDDRSSGNVFCRVQVFDRLTAPPYAALSYTWGPEWPYRIITVNASPFVVRENCFYALWQIRRHGLARHYWIDSLCINQDDRAEKSRQVDMMGETFRRAVYVLASVGRPVYMATAIVDAVSELRRTRGGWISEDFTCDTVKELTESWVNELDLNRLWALYNAFRGLASLPYWTRVWIVQELHVAGIIRLLIGSVMLDWGSIVLLDRALEQRMDALGSRAFSEPLDVAVDEEVYFHEAIRYRDSMSNKDDDFLARGHFRDIIRNRSRGWESLGFFEAIRAVLDSQCLDPRDRVYGVLSFVKWPRNVARLVPDYTKSTHELGIDALRYYASETDLWGLNRIFEHARTLVQALQIKASDAEVLKAVVQRRMPRPGRSNDSSTTASTRLDPKISVAVDPKGCCRLETNQYGYLAAPLLFVDPMQDGSGWSMFDALEFESSRGGGGGSDSVGDAAHSDSRGRAAGSNRSILRRLYHGRRVVGYACADARPGDFLAMINMDHEKHIPGHLGLILRPRQGDNEMYDVIGQVLTRYKYGICGCGRCNEPRPGHSWSTNYMTDGIGFRIQFDREDLLIFAAQDVGSAVDTQHRYLERLSTRVTKDGQSTYARLVRHEDAASQDERARFARTVDDLRSRVR